MICCWYDGWRLGGLLLSLGAPSLPARNPSTSLGSTQEVRHRSLLLLTRLHAASFLTLYSHTFLLRIVTESDEWPFFSFNSLLRRFLAVPSILPACLSSERPTAAQPTLTDRGSPPILLTYIHSVSHVFAAAAPAGSLIQNDALTKNIVVDRPLPIWSVAAVCHAV